MDETYATATPTTSPQQAGTDDVWGVNRPPALPPTSPQEPGTTQHVGATAASGWAASARPTLDRGLSALQRSPLRRNTRGGVVGGVASGIAARLGVSTAAVRVSAVLLSLFFGVGVGAYLLAWALLPDERGATHATQALHDGRPASLAVVGLAALPVLGFVAGAVGSAWPLLLAAAAVAYVVSRRKGRPAAHTHG